MGLISAKHIKEIRDLVKGISGGVGRQNEAIAGKLNAPTTAGASGQVLTSDGAGGTTWSNGGDGGGNMPAGGAAGAFLVKASAADYDASWIVLDNADSTSY